MKKNNTEEYSGFERRVLAAILSSGFISTLGIGLFSFTIPLLSLDEKISGIWLGTAFAGYYLAKLLISPVSGVLADRVGPRLPLLLAALVGTAAPLLYFVHSSMAVLYGVQFIMGLVAGLIKPVGLAALGGNIHQHRLSRWFSLHAFVFSLALFIGPFLGGFLYLKRSMEPILLTLSLCMGLTAIILFSILPKEVRTQSVIMGDENVSSNKYDAMSLLLAIAGRTLGIGLVASFYPILLATTLGQSGLVVGAVFAIPSLMVCVGLPVVGRLSKGKPTAMIVVVGMLVSAGALFALGACRETWQFVVFGGVMGLGAAISIPSSMALASGLTRSQGKVFGTAHFAAGIGFLIGPLLGGMIVQSSHAVGPALQMAAMIGACVCMPLFSSALREQLNWGKGFAWSGAFFCLILLGGFGSLHLLPQSGDFIAGESGLYQYTDVAMGTVVKLTLEADSQKAADDASRKVLGAMRTLQQDFDYRDPDGSIGQINRAAGKYWVVPSSRAYALLRRTLAFSAETDGVFDPTIGALTTSPLYYVLDETIAKSKKGLVDYRLVMLEDGDKQVRLKKEGMALDMGGIAKGTIIDAAVKVLRGLGVGAGIVEAGGDFYCFGDRDWKVGIRHPRAEQVYGTVIVRDKGVCGSGDYEQFVTTESGGESLLQHHIINPADMEPADKSIGVTVIADSAELADALATAIFIMGAQQGRAFMQDRYPTESAMWFKPDLSVVVTDNFPK